MDMEPSLKKQQLQTAISKLKVADIVLIRNKKSWVARLISSTTSSYWTHVALVFALPQLDSKHHEVLIVEALDQGIEVHRLQEYINNPEEYDVGFKRMSGLTEVERDRIRGFFLDAVDAPYNYWRLFFILVKKVLFAYIGRGFFDFVALRASNFQNYLCTTFAQRAFYLALPSAKRKKAFFRAREKDSNFNTQMEEITPSDFARSENTVWLYNPHR